MRGARKTAALAAPTATNPAANPAIVPSIITGKTLFVPVEIGMMGTSALALATMRLGVTPRVARYIRTASARACDRRALVAAAPVLSV